MCHLILRRVLPAWLMLHIFLVLLSACASPAQPTPPAPISAAALPANWQRIELVGASLALPSTWSTVVPDALDLDEAIIAMAVENPQLAAALEQGQAELASGEIQLIAFDLAPDNLRDQGFPTNLRLGRHTYPDAPEPQQVADVNEQDLRATGGFSDIARTPVTLANLPATRLTSILTVNNDVQPLRLAIEQYILVIERDVLVLTFTTPQAQQANYRTTFDQILATLRITATP